jgi:hypothetical protein
MLQHLLSKGMNFTLQCEVYMYSKTSQGLHNFFSGNAYCLVTDKRICRIEKVDKLCSPCEVLLYMYTSHCNVKFIPFDKFNFVKLPVSPRWRTAINIKTLFFCTDFLFFSVIKSGKWHISQLQLYISRVDIFNLFLNTVYLHDYISLNY